MVLNAVAGGVGACDCDGDCVCDGDGVCDGDCDTAGGIE